MPVLSTDTARLNGMPKPSAATTPFHLVYGGDSYLSLIHISEPTRH